MKYVYFVMGPESSGNRMLVDTIQSCENFSPEGGYDGERDKYVRVSNWLERCSKDWYKAMTESLLKASDKVVFSRSIPRGGWPNKKWFPLANTCKAMFLAGRTIFPLVPHRIKEYVMESQVRRRHVLDHETSRGFIEKAYEHIFSELSEVRLNPIIVKYEYFVMDKNYRDWILEQLDLRNPSIEFFNANEKYQ